ncbi:MAG: copper amine oxidase N-terminal domain-containing protein [Clostridia bacterium]
MKKRMISLAITLAVVLGLSTFSLGAAPSVTEAADVGVIVAGKEQKYAQPPIIVDGSTFLPLRALAATLGIPNDDAHIAWNGADKSVTLKSADGAKTIFLQIGSKAGRVNDAEKTLNAAPELYKNSTYIPLRFVADALDMTVLWDAKNRDVYIRSSAEYEQVLTILNKMRMKNPDADGKFKYTFVKNITDSTLNTNTRISNYKETFDYILNTTNATVFAKATVSTDKGSMSATFSTDANGIVTCAYENGKKDVYTKEESFDFLSEAFGNAWMYFYNPPTPAPDPKPDPNTLSYTELACMYSTVIKSANTYTLSMPQHLIAPSTDTPVFDLSYVVDADSFVIFKHAVDGVFVSERDGVSINRALSVVLDFTVK